MQFIKHGPDIPDSLLEAHEEGRVVFFCGAGMAYPAGLPDFGGLVDGIYKELGTTLTNAEKQAYARENYDAVLDLLERRLPGQRTAVRTALMKVLKPKWRRPGALDTHTAVLQLARTREGSLRLVTTNFDRIFQRAIKRSKLATPTYPAPLLPIPKASRWNGLVYLHGLMPEIADASALNRLVLTSGDFGLAYLTERWAARFVSELFRNYIVCFVGYSINDPVMRYMMDALAADRALGEVTPEAYAFGDFQAGHESSKYAEWEAKGVVPILYEVPASTRDHSALHLTLKTWSETYRDGVPGKERIVLEHAITRPSASTKQDDFVGRMLWALSHESGIPAKRFAEFDPAPALDWLEAFSEERYRHFDLTRFGVQPAAKEDENLTFSLTRRPAPYSKAPWMLLVSGGATFTQWDNVLAYLAHWLTRHLNDPELLLWLVQRGGQLDKEFSRLVGSKLGKLAKLERTGNTAELDRIRSNAPNAIPEPVMRVLWRIFLSGSVKSHWRDRDLYGWKSRLSDEGISAPLRLELRELLTPKVLLKRSFVSDDETSVSNRPLDYELTLAADHVHYVLKDLQTSQHWPLALSAMVDDFEQLLRDALDLLRELGEADDERDRSHWDMPSIGAHWQNRGYREWVALIALLRDAWLVIFQSDPHRARYIAQGWYAQPYPTFKRLAFFAATHEGVTPNGEWVDWLLSNDGWWLWSVETRREMMRLLVEQGRRLPNEARARLEDGILSGPPRQAFPEGSVREESQGRIDHMIWQRLAKLAASDAQLGGVAAEKLAALSRENPNWKLAEDQRDEFSHWMSGTGDPDYESRNEIVEVPRGRKELAAWLAKEEPSDKFFYEDNWRETCNERFLTSVGALSDLARQNVWPAGHWREALQAWSEERNLASSWKYVAPLLRRMPDEVFLQILHSVAWWLEAVSKVLDGRKQIFFQLCQRVLGIQHDDEVNDEHIVTKAINHPVGQVTQALLNFWFRSEPNDNQGLPAELQEFLSWLCNTQVSAYIYGRVVLASRLIALFRVDGAWTRTFLLPLFSWNASELEARGVWEGFLWAPRLYLPLFTEFKNDFLETALYYEKLGEHGRQYVALLTYAALDPTRTFSDSEFRDAISALPPEGLQESAQTLVQALESAGEQRESYWKNRIEGFWHELWPKSLHFMSKPISEQLAQLAIAAQGEFPRALSVVQGWLQPLEHPYYVIHLLEESGLCTRYPNESLDLLSTVIDGLPYAPDELGECLDAIALASPGLQSHRSFQRLRTLLAR